MGIFQQFPYSNFHEMNLDEILRIVKELGAEWSVFKTEVSNDINEFREYIESQLNDDKIKQYVSEVIDELIASGFFDETINAIVSQKSLVNTNLVGSFFFSYTEANAAAYANGSCYIGNGLYALYRASSTADLGRLTIIEMDSSTIISDTPLNCKHGNSVTFNHNNSCIYICNCFSRNDTQTLIPDITVINVSDPTAPVIVETVTPPIPNYTSGIYSLVFDPMTNLFHATCARGTTEGEFNRVITYNEDLTEIVGEIVLKDALKADFQGIQSAYDNKGYILYLGSDFHGLYVYDLRTGNLISIFSFPDVINGFRRVGESQSVFFDDDHNKWYCVSYLSGAGVAGHIATSIFEMGLYRPIPNRIIGEFQLTLWNTQKLTFAVRNGVDGVPTLPTDMRCIMDAIELARTLNRYPVIFVNTDTATVGSLTIKNFKGEFAGTSAKHLKFSEIEVFSSEIYFSYCDFEGTLHHSYRPNEDTSLAIYNSKITFAVCSFTNPCIASEALIMNWNNNWHGVFIRCLLTCYPATLTNSTWESSGFVGMSNS